MSKARVMLCATVLAGLFIARPAAAQPASGFCGRTIQGKIICWLGPVVAEKVVELGIQEIWAWYKGRPVPVQPPDWVPYQQQHEQWQQRQQWQQQQQQQRRGWGWPSGWPPPPPQQRQPIREVEEEDDDE